MFHRARAVAVLVGALTLLLGIPAAADETSETTTTTSTPGTSTTTTTTPSTVPPSVTVTPQTTAPTAPPPAPAPALGAEAAGAEAVSAIQFGVVYYDPPGADVNTNAQRNREYIAVKNRGTRARNLAGWTIRDAAGHTYRFPSFTLGAGKTVLVRTGSGLNGAVSVFWGSTSYIWNNGGDVGRLRNQFGTIADTCVYAGGAPGYAPC